MKPITAHTNQEYVKESISPLLERICTMLVRMEKLDPSEKAESAMNHIESAHLDLLKAYWLLNDLVEEKEESNHE